MPSAWTQHEEDPYRLPEGFKRISYDADTKRYTFIDTNTGALYQSEPGVEYGQLTPIPSATTSVDHARPRAFAPTHRSQTLPVGPVNQAEPPMTFSDILPPELITSSTLSAKKYNKRSMSAFSSSSDSSNKNKAPQEQLVDAARRSALPRMQGVVHSLRRSVTSLHRPTPKSGLATSTGSGFGRFGGGGTNGYQSMNEEEEYGNEQRGLMRNDSTAEATSRGLDRASSMMTSSTTRDSLSTRTKSVSHS